MSQSNYKITITDHDYYYTTYTAWVQASSQNRAIAKAGALAGQEKNRREYTKTGRVSDLWPGGLNDPDIKIEHVDLDEFWEKRDTVEVSS